MPATARKSRIRKAATAVEALAAPAPQTFELTNMEIEEVSMVDRPANQREFLLRKKAEKAAPTASAETADDEIDLAAAQKAADELKAKDAAQKAAEDAQRAEDARVAQVDKAKWSKAFIDGLPDSSFLYVESGKKDEDGKTVPRSNRHFPYKNADGDVDLPHLRDAASRIPQSDLPDDKKKSLSDKAAKLLDKEDKKSASKAAPAPEVVTDPAAAAAELAAATKADITVSTPSGDVTVTVDEPEAPAPVAPQALIDRVKAATLAGIDAVAERLAKMRADVDANPTPFYSATGASDALWSHVWYIKAMLDALYDIGGPEWEIESAGDSANDVDKAHGVKKGHKAITAARSTKLAAVHKCMTYAMKDFAGVLKELDNDPEENVVEEDEDEPVSTNKAATPPAPVPAPVVVAPPAAPVIPPQIAAQLAEFGKQVDTLKATVAKQATEIARARNTVSGSNAQQIDDEKVATSVPGHDTVIWPADMAAKPTRQRF